MFALLHWLAPALGGAEGGVTLEPELELLVSEAALGLGMSPADLSRVLVNSQGARQATSAVRRARAALVAEIVRLLIDDSRPELSDAAREQLGELESTGEDDE